MHKLKCPLFCESINAECAPVWIQMSKSWAHNWISGSCVGYLEAWIRWIWFHLEMSRKYYSRWLQPLKCGHLKDSLLAPKNIYIYLPFLRSCHSSVLLTDNPVFWIPQWHLKGLTDIINTNKWRHIISSSSSSRQHCVNQALG